MLGLISFTPVELLSAADWSLVLSVSRGSGYEQGRVAKSPLEVRISASVVFARTLCE